MPTIKTNDIEMYYMQEGEGPDLVLITGLSCDHTVWLNVVEPLSKNFRVTIFDNRGAGKTNITSDDFSIKQMADDVAALMAALKIDSAYIVGHSMGGMIAQELAIRHAQKIKKLILYATSPCLDDRTMFYAEQIPLLREMYPNDKLLIHRAIGLPVGFSKSFFANKNLLDETLSFLEEAPDMITIDNCKKQTKACREFDTRSQLNKIASGTLVISPSDDLLIPPVDSEYLAREIPNARLIKIPGFSHCWYLEEPDKFVETICEFFLN